MTFQNLIQWPALVVTLFAVWLVAAQSKKKRRVGFCLFLLSNALWVTWGMQAQAAGLITLHCCLAALNVRGLFKNDPDAQVFAKP